jgi:type VI secretion system protein ImpC
MGDPVERNALAPGDSPSQELDLIERILAESRMARDEGEQAKTRTVALEPEGQATAGPAAKTGVHARAKALIDQIDSRVSEQLNAIMHHVDFQRLDASWRGLHYLVRQNESPDLLKIRVLNVSKEALFEDMNRALDFENTTLFKKVYEEEFGSAGGEPFGALIGDYEFTHRQRDVELLKSVSNVAAAAHAPFLAGASPVMFDLSDFNELRGPGHLNTVFGRPEYAPWQSFRDSMDSRYAGLCLPRILLRPPYIRDTDSVKSFTFQEDVTKHQNFLWGNSAYAFAARTMDSFANYHWHATVLGTDGVGLVHGLPIHIGFTDRAAVNQNGPTETSIPPEWAEELSKEGFIPLHQSKETDYAAFLSAQSCHRSRSSVRDTADGWLWSKLPYVLIASRIAHYLKVICREKAGSMTSPEEASSLLNKWILQYVTHAVNPSQEERAKYPLSDARVEVVEAMGSPGMYRATVSIQPHYQLEDLTTPLRLVTDLTRPTRGR